MSSSIITFPGNLDEIERLLEVALTAARQNLTGHERETRVDLINQFLEMVRESKESSSEDQKNRVVRKVTKDILRQLYGQSN